MGFCCFYIEMMVVIIIGIEEFYYKVWICLEFICGILYKVICNLFGSLSSSCDLLIYCCID